MSALARTLGLLGVLCAATLVACEDGTEPPVPGDLVVQLVTPNANDRAVVITITGDLGTIRAVPGVRTFSAGSDSTRASLIVVPEGGSAFGAGDVPLVRFSVDDVNRIDTYEATLDEVATTQYGVRASLEGYALEILAADG